MRQPPSRSFPGRHRLLAFTVWTALFALALPAFALLGRHCCEPPPAASCCAGQMVMAGGDTKATSFATLAVDAPVAAAAGCPAMDVRLLTGWYDAQEAGSVHDGHPDLLAGSRATQIEAGDDVNPGGPPTSLPREASPRPAVQSLTLRI